MCGRENGGPIGNSRGSALEGTWLIDIFGATKGNRQIASAQQNLVGLSQETIDLARSSYELGETDFLSILDTEVSLQDAREALAAAERDRAINFVRLQVATAASMPPLR